MFIPALFLLFIYHCIKNRIADDEWVFNSERKDMCTFSLFSLDVCSSIEVFLYSFLAVTKTTSIVKGNK